MEMGIMPNMIACRAAHPVKESVREKISMYTNVPMKRVVSMHDVESIYSSPSPARGRHRSRGPHLLDLHDRVEQRNEDKARTKWRWFVEPHRQGQEGSHRRRHRQVHRAARCLRRIMKALEHCGVHPGVSVNIKWIDTTSVDPSTVTRHLKDVHGIIVPGGFGIRGTEGKIQCIRHARENKIPYLGLCLGFQMAVIEYARNVAQIADANSRSLIPAPRTRSSTSSPSRRRSKGLGGNMRLGGKDVEIKPDTLAFKLFDNQTRIRLRFRHRYEVDPKFIPALEEAGLIFSGKHPQQPIMQILELPQDVHPYFIGTQAHPELTSRPLRQARYSWVWLKRRCGTRNRERHNRRPYRAMHQPEPLESAYFSTSWYSVR
jgi:CTP synthase